MSDKEFSKQKKRVQKYIDKWFETMGLGWFKVKFEWSREPDGEVAGRTWSMWQYKQATITWFLPHLAECDDETIESTVVHEFCHILLSGLAQNQDNLNDELTNQINEYTTEIVARAMMWAREAGEK